MKPLTPLWKDRQTLSGEEALIDLERVAFEEGPICREVISFPEEKFILKSKGADRDRCGNSFAQNPDLGH
jgi:hypothetical protein